MKILFVTSCYPSIVKPQYCIFLHQQAKALCEIGHSVDVLYINANKEKEKIDDFYLFDGIKIFNWFYKTSRLKELLLLNHKSNAIEKFFNENEYDIVHLHMGGVRPFSCVVNECEKKAIKKVIHFAGLNIWHDCFETFKIKLNNNYKNFFQKRMLKKLNACICISKVVENELLSKMPKLKSFVVYNGVDNGLFLETQNNQDIFTIICVANLIPIKGQKYLIDAVAKVIDKGCKVKLKIVGGGPDREKLETQCKELGIENSVNFFGILPYERVAEEMMTSDMFIMPSFFEGLGCVYLEAMSCGLLTCGCDTNNGIREIIISKENGLLLKEKDSDSIVDAILLAIENPKEAKVIAEKGKETALQFTWINSARELEKAYNKVLVES